MSLHTWRCLCLVNPAVVLWGARCGTVARSCRDRACHGSTDEVGFANCFNLLHLITGKAAGSVSTAEFAALRAASLGRPCTAMRSGPDISLC